MTLKLPKPTYALASCDETKELLKYLYDTGSLRDKKQYDYFLKGYDELGAKISRFISTVESGHLTRKS
ncbi:MAG: four helix bundle protein [candidate division WOR-3 bacterium]|nr:four helix bundle protein [candidate division WOR-3 bacterium]